MKPNKDRASDLVQEDWDFSACPPGREYYCWAYEYAREVPKIIERYQAARDADFDEYGNWYWEPGSHEEDAELEPCTILLLPPGFPKKPYLLTTQVIPKEPTLVFSKVSTATDWPLGGMPESVVKLRVDWRASDSALVKDFRKWLLEARPRKPMVLRGRSTAKECMADLKALGAYRLLARMTARDARSHVEKCGRMVYAKLPDWYEAKKRARGVLRTLFRKQM